MYQRVFWKEKWTDVFYASKDKNLFDESKPKFDMRISNFYSV